MHGGENGFGKLTRDCGFRIENSDRNKPKVSPTLVYVLATVYNNMDK